MESCLAEYEKGLYSFDPAVRKNSLRYLAQSIPSSRIAPPFYRVNMHCHSFFSYNGYQASPSAIAWKAVQDNWAAAAICDFDVLDGLDEFLAAGDCLNLRTAVHMETRVYFPEYAHHEINSPGEPGVYYFMGAGFTQLPPKGTRAAKIFAQLRQASAQRNEQVISRVNQFLGNFQLDYQRDVLPLTPTGNATERHICLAYFNRSKLLFPDPKRWGTFWAEACGESASKMENLYEDSANFSEILRSKLMKKGGPGYVQPDAGTFPHLDEVIHLVRESGALPMATWLDGFSSGEADLEPLLQCQIEKGIVALNIIPDRNWNLKDPNLAREKAKKLAECVTIANRLNLPINVGTELNKTGQRWLDDFDAEPMRPHQDTFALGAMVMIGHTRLARYAHRGYLSEWAQAEYPHRADRNRFFAEVGKLPVPPPTIQKQLVEEGPNRAFDRIRQAVQHGYWK